MSSLGEARRQKRWNYNRRGRGGGNRAFFPHGAAAGAQNDEEDVGNKGSSTRERRWDCLRVLFVTIGDDVALIPQQIQRLAREAENAVLSWREEERQQQQQQRLQTQTTGDGEHQASRQEKDPPQHVDAALRTDDLLARVKQEPPDETEGEAAAAEKQRAQRQEHQMQLLGGLPVKQEEEDSSNREDAVVQSEYEELLVQLIVACVSQLPVKIGIYSSILGLWYKKSRLRPLCRRTVDVALDLLEASLKKGDFSKVALLLRFFLALASSFVLPMESVFDVLKTLLSLTLALPPGSTTEHLLLATLSSLPWISARAYEQQRSTIDKVVGLAHQAAAAAGGSAAEQVLLQEALLPIRVPSVTADACNLLQQQPHESAAGGLATLGLHQTRLDSLLDALASMVEEGWRSRATLRFYQSSELYPLLKPVAAPTRGKSGVCTLRPLYLTVADLLAIRTPPVRRVLRMPVSIEKTSIPLASHDRWILEEYILTTFRNFRSNVGLCAEQLLRIPVEHEQFEFVLVECLFSEMFKLPHSPVIVDIGDAPFLVTRVLHRASQLQNSLVAVVEAALTSLVKHAAHFDYNTTRVLADFFAYWLNAWGGPSRLLEEWLGLSIPPACVKSFVRIALEKAFRLRYRQELVALLPACVEPYWPANPLPECPYTASLLNGKEGTTGGTSAEEAGDKNNRKNEENELMMKTPFSFLKKNGWNVCNAEKTTALSGGGGVSKLPGTYFVSGLFEFLALQEMLVFTLETDTKNMEEGSSHQIMLQQQKNNLSTITTTTTTRAQPPPNIVISPPPGGGPLFLPSSNLSSSSSSPSFLPKQRKRVSSVIVASTTTTKTAAAVAAAEEEEKEEEEMPLFADEEEDRQHSQKRKTSNVVEANNTENAFSAKKNSRVEGKTSGDEEEKKKKEKKKEEKKELLVHKKQHTSSGRASSADADEEKADSNDSSRNISDNSNSHSNDGSRYDDKNNHNSHSGDGSNYDDGRNISHSGNSSQRDFCDEIDIKASDEGDAAGSSTRKKTTEFFEESEQQILDSGEEDPTTKTTRMTTNMKAIFCEATKPQAPPPLLSSSAVAAIASRHHHNENGDGADKEGSSNEDRGGGGGSDEEKREGGGGSDHQHEGTGGDLLGHGDNGGAGKEEEGGEGGEEGEGEGGGEGEGEEGEGGEGRGEEEDVEMVELHALNGEEAEKKESSCCSGGGDFVSFLPEEEQKEEEQKEEEQKEEEQVSSSLLIEMESGPVFYYREMAGFLRSRLGRPPWTSAEQASDRGDIVEEEEEEEERDSKGEKEGGEVVAAPTVLEAENLEEDEEGGRGGGRGAGAEGEEDGGVGGRLVGERAVREVVCVAAGEEGGDAEAVRKSEERSSRVGGGEDFAAEREEVEEEKEQVVEEMREGGGGVDGTGMVVVVVEQPEQQEGAEDGAASSVDKKSESRGDLWTAAGLAQVLVYAILSKGLKTLTHTERLITNYAPVLRYLAENASQQALVRLVAEGTRKMRNNKQQLAEQLPPSPCLLQSSATPNDGAAEQRNTAAATSAEEVAVHAVAERETAAPTAATAAIENAEGGAGVDWVSVAVETAVLKTIFDFWKNSTQKTVLTIRQFEQHGVISKEGVVRFVFDNLSPTERDEPRVMETFELLLGHAVDEVSTKQSIAAKCGEDAQDETSIEKQLVYEKALADAAAAAVTAQNLVHAVIIRFLQDLFQEEQALRRSTLQAKLLYIVRDYAAYVNVSRLHEQLREGMCADFEQFLAVAQQMQQHFHFLASENFAETAAAAGRLASMQRLVETAETAVAGSVSGGYCLQANGSAEHKIS